MGKNKIIIPEQKKVIEKVSNRSEFIKKNRDEIIELKNNNIDAEEPTNKRKGANFFLDLSGKANIDIAVLSVPATNDTSRINCILEDN
jgi:hypothetical protein